MGTPLTFLQVAARSQIRTLLFSVKSIYLRTPMFISLPRQVRGCLYSSMIPCPPSVIASKSQLGQPWDADAFPGATRGIIIKSGMRSRFLSITLATHSCSEPDNFYGLQYYWYNIVTTSFASLKSTKLKRKIETSAKDVITTEVLRPIKFTQRHSQSS